MHPLVSEHLPQIIEICKRHRVRRVALFGSALDESFDPTRSDIDLMIDFEPLEAGQHAEQFFGLIEDLEDRLGRPVDVVESHMLRNKYVRRSVDQSHVVLYDAA